jgi:formiminoglutamase
MEKFPILISIPHGGDQIPVELQKRISLKKNDIFNDIDPFTREIYDLKDSVTYVIKTKIARTFIDVSRAPHDLPPKNPDGVIKSTTCYGVPIYQKNAQPDSKLIKQLLKKYYYPYHNKLKEVFINKDIEIAFDCHSMASVGPPISPDRGKKRPKICLGTRFGESCNIGTIKKLVECFKKSFFLKSKDVTINKPFAGGYIIRNYGKNPKPWIQIEINRELYLCHPYFTPDYLTVKKDRLLELNQMFENTISLFYET